MRDFCGVVYPAQHHGKKLIHTMMQPFMPATVKEREVVVHQNIALGHLNCTCIYNPTKEVCLLFDGHVNNQGALYEKLKKRGAAPSGASLQELLLAAYSVWGKEMTERIEGPFALAIINWKKQYISLARDRLGEKVLYWAFFHNHLLFSTNLKSLLCSGKVPQECSPHAAASYLALGYVPQDQTIFQGVNRLLPGYELHHKFSCGINVSSYWSYSNCFSASTATEESLRQEITRAFTPLDRGNKTWSYLHMRQKTSFSALVNQYNTLPDSHLVTIADDHKNLLTSTVDKSLIKVLYAIEEPIAHIDTVRLWQSLLALKANKVTNLISLVGGEEVLQLHRRYQAPPKASSPLLMRLSHTSDQLLFSLFNLFSRQKALYYLRYGAANPQQCAYCAQQRLISNPLLKKIAPDLAPLFDERSLLQKFYQLKKFEAGAPAFAYYDIKTSLPDVKLLLYDKLCNTIGIECYAPFLSTPLVELLASIQAPSSIDPLSSSPLMQWISQLTPPSSPLISLPPPSRNFVMHAHQDPVLNRLYKLLPKGVLVQSGILSPRWLRKAVAVINNEAISRTLWSILVLEVWYRLFITRPAGAIPQELTVTELFME